jgi:hypothetical protein
LNIAIPARYAIIQKILLTIAVLTAADFATGWLSDLLKGASFPYGRSSLALASDLAFAEGAFIFLVGSILALISSGFKLREKALISIGACMFGISMVFGIFA